MKVLYVIMVFTLPVHIMAQSPFAPAAGEEGTTALNADSSAFVEWSNNLEVERGWLNISDTVLGKVDYGTASNAEGMADGAVVSLGDGGVATYTLQEPLADTPGPEFAVFENGLSNNFLELAFVEVSSDGQNFARFPATSFTQSNEQIDSFGELQPAQLYNFAGKYRADYGTPFDLQELADSSNIDIQAVTHIRLVDVIGAVNQPFSTYDNEGHQVNDPWPTSFASGGFDLDALGIIQPAPSSLIPVASGSFGAYPNPANRFIYLSHVSIGQWVQLYSIDGKRLTSRKYKGAPVDVSHLLQGVYLIQAGNQFRQIVIQ